jgi:plastocyanin
MATFGIITRAVLILGVCGAQTLLAATHEVHIQRDFTFSPAEVTVNVGDSILFTNDTRAPHTVTADPALVGDASSILLPVGATPFDSGVIEPTKTFTLVLSIAGDYKYTCLPHESMGMQGRIHVVAPPAELN